MHTWFDLRPPRGGVALFAGLLIVGGVAAAWQLATGDDTWYFYPMAIVVLPLGIGLWLKHSWARWTTFTLVAIGIPLVVLGMFYQGITSRGALRLLMHVCLLYMLWSWDVYPASDSPSHKYEDDPSADQSYGS